MAIIKRFQDLDLNLKIGSLLLVSFAILLAAITLVLINNISSLTFQVSQQRVHQEVALMESRLQEYADTFLNSGLALAGSPGMAEAVEKGDLQTIQTLLLINAEASGADNILVYDANRSRIVNLQGNVPSDADMPIPERLI